MSVLTSSVGGISNVMAGDSVKKPGSCAVSRTQCKSTQSLRKSPCKNVFPWNSYYQEPLDTDEILGTVPKNTLSLMRGHS